MKRYICDNCDDDIVDPVISLEGHMVIFDKQEHTVMPEEYYELEFCCNKCFFEWAQKYDPENTAKVAP